MSQLRVFPTGKGMSRCKGQASSVDASLPAELPSRYYYLFRVLPFSQAVHLSLQFSNNTFETHGDIRL